MSSIEISDSTDYSAEFISENFEQFIDHLLDNKKVHKSVERYIECVCGDILMCNADMLDEFQKKLDNKQVMITFEEKIYAYSNR